MNHTRMTVYLQPNAGFVLIPYPMREGQAPRDILPEYRFQWVPLENGHSVIAKDVAWYPGAYDEIDAVDIAAVREESARLKAERDLAQRRREAAEQLAGQIWLMSESLALEMALSARHAGEAFGTVQGCECQLLREPEAFVVYVDGAEVYRHREAMEAARWLVAYATKPGQRAQMPELLAA
ncbi:MAG: hypothetical protein AzoDbin1_01850 [Azoarcus sp.]|nr:hypothetical protein [Azoarcus sp.]